jgi:anti-sigma-K factor RskA
MTCVELQARIAELESVIRQLSRDPEMADEYVLGQINIENKARIAELEKALLDAANRASLHSSDAALLNANNDRIFKICRKALKEPDE